MHDKILEGIPQSSYKFTPKVRLIPRVKISYSVKKVSGTELRFSWSFLQVSQ
jgi:hypothetical protein